MVQKIIPNRLQLLFIEALETVDFKLIEGMNPFHLEVKGKEYYIYIKNLSPAYFANPDVWRVQLPIRADFNDIKKTDAPFILLGYDADNDVYATWNPLWTKQRLNNAESVSFYSRLSVQQEANQTKEFRRKTLNNDGEVVVFPRESLPLFFATIKSLFKSSGDYVALGSKKRTEANEAYKMFSNSANVPKFARYLNEKSFSTVTINNYSRIIKTLINDGTFTSNRRLFLAYDKIEDYLEVVDELLEQPDVKERNEKWHHLISAALRSYINFLVLPACKEDNNVEGYSLEARSKETLQDTHVGTYLSKTDPLLDDWERPCIDKDGKLTKITNPGLLKMIEPYLNKEYREPMTAYNLIDDFYGSRFSSTMELKDWRKLINEIQWDNSTKAGTLQSSNVKVSTQPEAKPKRSKAEDTIMRVIFPDGLVVENSNAAQTLCDVIELIGPDKVEPLGIIQVTLPLVSKKNFHHVQYTQKEIENGWYVTTFSSTKSKVNQIKRISKDLNLGLNCEICPKKK